MASFEDLIDKHGLPENTPMQQSASGGTHFFFSLSRSMENGLNSTRNSTKIKINNIPMSIDTRADGGCIIVDPSSMDQKKYRFVSPLVSRQEMPAMPDWCIEILNNNHSYPSKKDQAGQSSLCGRMASLSLEPDMGHHRVLVFLSNIKSVIEKTLGTEIARQWIRSNGFDFKPRSIVECALCGKTHESNNYFARQIIEDCFFMSNYSSMCPSRAFNWESHECLKIILRAPTGDKAYSMMLNASFRSRGNILVHAYNMKSKQGRFKCFNGHIWQEISEPRVFNDIGETCGTILSALLKHVRPDLNAAKDEKKLIGLQRKQFAKGLRFVEKSTNLKNILTHYRILYTDEVLESRLDKNPEMLVVKNGTIDLETGELRRGRASDYMSRQLDVEYKGLDAKTDLINDFIGELFNKDQDAIQYLQRLLGYGITGRTDSQVWAMFTGEGSNGKSLLASLLKSLLGDWLVTTPHEIFFKGRRANDGAHSTHLAPLKGRRICIKEETEPTEQLNTEILKMITGGGEISMRTAFAREYEEFEPMVLPILLCNHRPAVDIDDRDSKLHPST
ncbi:hypothetical protein BGX26_004512, partial [Mortierella sp. AD094]